MPNANYTVIIKTTLQNRDLKKAEREAASTFDRIAKSAENAAKRELAAVNSLQRQRSTALFSAWRAEQRQFEQMEKAKQRAAEQAAKAQQRAAEQAAQASTRAYEQFAQRFQVSFAQIKTVALSVFAAIGTASAAIGLAINRAMDFDVIERGLKMVAGTAVEAQKQMARLKELARLPGLGLKEAIQASIALQIGFQTSIKDTAKRVSLAEDVIKQFSNAIALTGGGPEVFQRVITQLTQMSNAGKVLMTDLRPIIQAAPALGQSLVKAFGTISPEEINALGLSSEEFMRRWVKALAEMERAPDSAANSWTNFTNAFDQALVRIGKPFLEPLTRGLNSLEPLLEGLSTRVGELFTMIGQDGAKIWADLPAGTKAAFADMLKTVQNVGGQIVGWFKTNYPLMLEAATNVLNQIAEFWTAHGETLKKNLQISLTQIADTLKLGLQILKGDWEGAGATFVSVLTANGKRLLAITEQNLNLIEGAIRKAIPVLGKIAYGMGKAIAQGVWDGIRDSDTVTKIKLWALDLALAARNSLLIRSPSLVFKEIGANIGQGLILGLQSTAPGVQQTLADMLDVAAGKFTKAPKKPAEAAAKQIAKILRDQAEALREIGGKESAVDRMNRLLADPSVAKRIDERTRAILRMGAAIEDAQGLTRQRTVIGRPRVVDELAWLEKGSIRDRRVGPEPDTRPRTVGDEVQIQMAQAYAGVLDDLNGKLRYHGDLTQVQITLQRLEEAGLADLTDARTQEALAMAAQIDMREKIRNVAQDISSIFANAVQDWSGSIGSFFKSIGRGFADLLKNMIANVVFSNLTGVFQNLLGRMFSGGGGQVLRNHAGGASGGGGFGGIIRSLTGGFAGGPSGGGLLSSAMGSGIGIPASATAMSGSIGGLGGFATQAMGMTGAAGTSALGSGSLTAGLGAMLPMLGMGLGTTLGGQSRLGSIFGGAGGLIGGGIGAAFLAPGMFASTGLFGSMGPAISGLLTNPFTIAAAGALIVTALILRKNAARRADEKKRDVISTDTGTAIWDLIDQARTLGLSGSTARWKEIEKNYRSQIAQIKDSKTRRHAELQWTNDFAPLWRIVEARAKEGDRAKDFSAAFVPTYATGGLVPYMGGMQTLIKVRPGERIDDVGMMRSWTVPGHDRGVDSVYTMATPGSAVRTRQQQSVPGFGNGSGMGGPIKITVEKVIVDASGITMSGMRSSDGRKVLMEVLAQEIISKDGGEVVGPLTQAQHNRGYNR